jgi:hypothetical protein
MLGHAFRVTALAVAAMFPVFGHAANAGHVAPETFEALASIEVSANHLRAPRASLIARPRVAWWKLADPPLPMAAVTESSPRVLATLALCEGAPCKATWLGSSSTSLLQGSGESAHVSGARNGFI